MLRLQRSQDTVKNNSRKPWLCVCRKRTCFRCSIYCSIKPGPPLVPPKWPPCFWVNPILIYKCGWELCKCKVRGLFFQLDKDPKPTISYLGPVDSHRQGQRSRSYGYLVNSTQKTLVSSTTWVKVSIEKSSHTENSQTQPNAKKYVKISLPIRNKS